MVLTMKKAILFLLFISMIVIQLMSFFMVFKVKEASSLINDVIFIDPGHGGKDNGTHYENVLEDELNLKLAKNLYEAILSDGGYCYLTRNDDYDLSYAYSKNHKLDDLKKRIEYIEKAKSTLFVSLHLNYYPNNNVNGLQVFYQKDNEKSKLLATTMQETLNKENLRKKKTKKGDFYLLNNCKVTGILIEYGFLSSEYDRKKLLDDKYLKQLANLIKSGINEYLKKYC